MPDAPKHLGSGLFAIDFAPHRHTPVGKGETGVVLEVRTRGSLSGTGHNYCYEDSNNTVRQPTTVRLVASSYLMFGREPVLADLFGSAP